MSRDMTAASLAAIGGSNVVQVIFVEMDFPSGFLRVNNSSQTFPWNGYDWLGVGMLGAVDPIVEASDMSANGVSFTISGVPQDNVAIALNQKYQGRACKVWRAFLDSSYAVIADPVGPFEFRMDTMDIELGATATIRVTAESKFMDWERNSAARYTHEEQQRRDPTDLGLQFVPQMAEKQIKWGWN